MTTYFSLKKKTYNSTLPSIRNVWLGQTNEAWVLHFNTKSGLKARNDGHAVKVDGTKDSFQIIDSFREKEDRTQSSIEILENIDSYEISVLLDYHKRSMKFYYNNGSESKVDIYEESESDYDMTLLYEFTELEFQERGVSPCFKVVFLL